MRFSTYILTSMASKTLTGRRLDDYRNNYLIDKEADPYATYTISRLLGTRFLFNKGAGEVLRGIVVASCTGGQINTWEHLLPNIKRAQIGGRSERVKKI